MKIAITGHTSGIGKAISDIQTLKGAEIKKQWLELSRKRWYIIIRRTYRI